MPLEQVLLGFLMQGPMHGYDLHQRVQEQLGEVWYMGLSNIYSALSRLEESGQVTCSLSPQESRPARKVHQITPAGKASFLEWMRCPVDSMRNMRVEFPAKLYFFRDLGLEGVEDLIARQEAICRERIERLKRTAERSASRDFDRLVYDFRRRQIEAILDWLGVCRELFIRE